MWSEDFLNYLHNKSSLILCVFILSAVWTSFCSFFLSFSRSKRRGRPRKHPPPPRPSLPSPSSSSSSSTSSASSSSGSSSSSSDDEDDDDEEDEEVAVGAVEPCAAPRCRLPQQDTVQWIQCDVCDAWYHIDCLHVDRKKLLKDPNADFHCGCRWQERNQVHSSYHNSPSNMFISLQSHLKSAFHWRQATSSNGHWAALLKHAELFSYLKRKWERVFFSFSHPGLPNFEDVWPDSRTAAWQASRPLSFRARVSSEV